jgi:hypothetical protein
MNVTQVGRGAGGHRLAAVAVGVLAAVGIGLLLYAATAGARLEVVLAALGCAAGACVVTLLSR